MDEIEKNLSKTFRKATEKYSETTSLRAAIQLIPYLGGPLDTLLNGKAAKIQQERILNFINDLNKRLRRIELEKQIDPDEEFYDLILSVFDGVLKTRSKDKQQKFAEIVKNKILDKGDWEEAENRNSFIKAIR